MFVIFQLCLGRLEFDCSIFILSESGDLFSLLIEQYTLLSLL